MTLSNYCPVKSVEGTSETGIVTDDPHLTLTLLRFLAPAVRIGLLFSETGRNRIPISNRLVNQSLFQ